MNSTLFVIITLSLVVGTICLVRYACLNPEPAVETFSVGGKKSQRQSKPETSSLSTKERPPLDIPGNDFALHELHSVSKLPNLFKKKQKSCKFFPSINNSFKCPKSHPFNTGASFGFDSDNITCNGESLRLKRAKGYAVLKNHKVESIQLLHPGEYYTDPPKVVLVGNCRRKATAYATITPQGTVDQVVVTDPGYGYKSTPKVHISKPTATLQCNMCCRVDPQK